MMVSPRRLSLGTGTAIVGLALILAMLGSGRATSSDARLRARQATAWIDSLSAGESDSLRSLSLAYLERARLGLGDPFRLVDEALHDPRLGASSRSTVAWAIVGRVYDHGTYEMDASLLDAVGPVGAGAEHLALIESVIRAAARPRIGEMTVRLAYQLASARGTVSAGTMPIITDMTSMVRDRVLAEQDLSRAVARADDDRISLLDAVVRLRADRELEVERPLLQAMSLADQDAAIVEVPRVVAEIESIQADPAGIAARGRSLIPVRLAPIVARLGARRPPAAAVKIVIQTRSAVLKSDTALAPSVRRYLAAATNEEALVAANSYVDHFSRSQSIAGARVMLAAAVALRASAQEPVWFAGDPAPSAGEIAGRFGLRRIEFDRDVPPPWRPYYVRMIGSALEDLQRVMPSYEPTGLTVRFIMGTLPDAALAMHDPRGHALLLPVMTAGGTIAHELAHDLDWQSARRLFARGGGYATDRSVQESGGPLATSIRGLAAAHAVNGAVAVARPADRPAEVFARGADWFIADALAQMGRSNGYLSAVEDQLLPGYATSVTDAPSLAGASALIDGLSEMTAIADSVESSYLGRWRSIDDLDPTAIVWRLGNAPVTMHRSRLAPGISRAEALDFTASPTCVLDRLRASDPRDRLIAWTIDARTMGLLLRRARDMSAGNRPAWAHALIGDAAWDPHAADEMIRRMTAAVVEGAGRARLIALPPAPFLPAC